MPALYTIGHSTHTLENFLAILRAYDINCIVDVRTIPKSRYVPWFEKIKLKAALNKTEIVYYHMPELGGLRQTNKNSVNQGWRNKSFRGYADYMQTSEFFEALKKLYSLLKKNIKCAVMCAEAVPWRCHRSLIADAELIRNINVFHIININSIRPHTITPFAVVNKNQRPIQLSYPKKKLSHHMNFNF